MFMKTKMCKFDLLGSCTKGERCPFAHNVDELAELPDLRCTKLCKNLITSGECNVSGCSYAHSRKELRATEEVNKRYKTKPCQFFETTGRCALGSKCNFAHFPGELRDLGADSAPEPQAAQPPQQAQQLTDVDTSGQNTMEDERSNVGTSYLGSPKYVQPRAPLLLDGLHFPFGCSQMWNEVADASTAETYSESTPLHMSSFQWPSIIGDRPVGCVGTLEAGNESSNLLERSWLGPLLPATLTSPLSKPMRTVRSSESTLCSLSDLGEQ